MAKYDNIEYDNLSYEDYNNGQYFVESKGILNPHYTDINSLVTKQPIKDDIANQSGMAMDDYSMYNDYVEDNGYNYNQGYDGYNGMHYNQGGLFGGVNYDTNYNEDDELKMLDRYFDDENY